ncbi:acyl-CoA thioesterase [Pseudofrancisella aestuarii]|uniref:Acyl-CoA thioesterase n=1 Tax=Pseudofrancisella aestuarii TaxID=2670347 RepID=A0ABV9TAN2_9GAMM|nr:thioesterase family protein [Pseudofrancisella aestuarii]
MKDSKYFLYSTTATSEHIDPNKHINNIIYLQWMQDAAVEHVKHNGTFDLIQSLGLTWFAKTHHIEYMSQGFLDDEIIVVTWVENLTKISTLRKYSIYRKSDKKLLCKGETLWIMINIEKSRPTKIPQNIIDVFHNIDDANIDDLNSLI